MRGAREYATLIITGQYGKLYCVSGEHARGYTFRIYVLPDGIKAIPNGSCNAPLNNDAVEVYGVVSGQPGWTETYGWLYHGPWCDDFNALVDKRSAEREATNIRLEQNRQDEVKKKLAHDTAILDAYSPTGRAEQ